MNNKVIELALTNGSSVKGAPITVLIKNKIEYLKIMTDSGEKLIQVDQIQP